MVRVALAIVGYGRAGLAAAQAAAVSGARDLLVVERRSVATVTDYPVRDRVTAVGLLAGGSGRPHTLVLSSSTGVERVQADRVVIATGAHEAPREALMIPGTRPAGVMTPALAFDLLDAGLLPGSRVVLFGAGRRLETLSDCLIQSGARVVAWVDPWRETADGDRLPGHVTEIAGWPRVERIRLNTLDEETWVDADALVCSTALLPAVHLAKGSGMQIDPGTRGPVVDQWGRTSIPGVYAAGTCIAPLLDHDLSAFLGTTVGMAAAGQAGNTGRSVQVRAEGVSWVAPQRVDPDSEEPTWICVGGAAPPAFFLGNEPVEPLELDRVAGGWVARLSLSHARDNQVSALHVTAAEVPDAR